MSVQSAVGLATAGDLITYEIRTCTRNRSSDNKSYVSSLTAGKTYREHGPLDATWDISLYAKSGELDIPDALETGKTLSVQMPAGASTEVMIIDSSALEVDIEGGEIIGISLTCSAVNANSYPGVVV